MQKRKVRSNTKYINEELDEFYFLGQLDGPLNHLEEIEILNCTTDFTGIISVGYRVKNLVIENLKCGGILNIHSEVPLENVKISGKFPKTLNIQPFNDGQYYHDNYSLDISEYRGEVEIIGVNIQNIKIDPSLHIKICLEQHRHFDLEGLSSFNIVKNMFRKLPLFKARQGVFQIYSGHQADYEQAFDKGLKKLD